MNNQQKPKVRKVTTGLGLLGTKYKKNPKYRDKPRLKKLLRDERTILEQ